ncbi:hypothetical protein HF086_009094 [Spodoptera exigua]|uniref:Uncharacterized protein n=1 Tax=Spodoptera exigua TaxID=7107 RepID=A0A922MM91_SPOEX|nr:hypothetical protein HF086_009094 [Spodoptera exigua]
MDREASPYIRRWRAPVKPRCNQSRSPVGRTRYDTPPCFEFAAPIFKILPEAYNTASRPNGKSDSPQPHLCRDENASNDIILGGQTSID